jgi:hypothetical protein
VPNNHRPRAASYGRRLRLWHAASRGQPAAGGGGERSIAS